LIKSESQLNAIIFLIARNYSQSNIIQLDVIFVFVEKVFIDINYIN